MQNLSLDEWKKAGEKSKELQKALLNLRMDIKVITQKEYDKKIHSTIKKFDTLRSYLDDVVCGQFKDRPDAEITGIFYGINEK